MLDDARDGRLKLKIFLVMNDVIDGVVCIPHVFETQIRLLQRAGCEVHMGLIDDRTSPEGILRNVRRIAGEINGLNPDLVVANYGSVTAMAARLAKGKRPFLVFFRGSDILGTREPGMAWRFRERVAKWLGIWAAGAAQSIIVNGDNVLNALPRHLKPRVLSIPNGTDVDLFRPMDRAECRRRLGWDATTRVVLFNAGASSSRLIKNPDLARQAVECLSRSMPDMRMYTMVDLNKEQVALAMNASDCLLITSFHEGSPDIVKEAMACNLPVVSVPCGDVAERLAGTHPSSICPYDPEALAAALRRILEPPCRSNGRERILAQGLDVESVTGRWIAEFGRAVEQYSRPRERQGTRVRVNG